MDGLPGDVAGALSRLEGRTTTYGAPTGGLERRLPMTDVEAVTEWTRYVGMAPGAYKSPTPTHLAKLLSEHARARKWPFDYVTPIRLGALLVKAGFERAHGGGAKGFRVDGPTNRKLWASTPPILRPKRQTVRKPRAPRFEPPLFWELLDSGRLKGRARPLVDTLGRVWPSARSVRLVLPRARNAHIQASAKGRGKQRGAVGVLWRYLTPEEVARIPRTQKLGQVVEWAAWGRTVAVSDSGSCATCGATRRTDDVAGVPPPPGFPTHPLDGT